MSMAPDYEPVHRREVADLSVATSHRHLRRQVQKMLIFEIYAHRYISYIKIYFY